MTTHRFAMAVISPAIEPRGDGSRRFTQRADKIPGGYVVRDANGHSRENEADRDGAPALKIAAGVDLVPVPAKLPSMSVGTTAGRLVGAEGRDRHPLASVGTLVLGLRCSWCPGRAPMPKILGLYALPPAATAVG